VEFFVIDKFVNNIFVNNDIFSINYCNIIIFVNKNFVINKKIITFAQNLNIMALSITIGSPVSGNDFFGREEELQKASTLLSGSNNLLLAAPRRVGKTSFAKRVADIKKEEGWSALYIDMEGMGSASKFFKRIYENLIKLPTISRSEKMKERVYNLLSGIKSASVSINPMNVSMDFSFSDEFEHLQEILSSLEGRIVIVLDELTVLLDAIYSADGEDAVRMFMNQMRSIRLATTGKCQWIICSSIGVTSFANQHNLSYTINDLARFSLGAYNNDEAKQFILTICDSLQKNITDLTTDYLLSKIGWNIPFFIQLIFSEIKDNEITEKSIDSAYDKLINSSNFDTWMERLVLEYGDKKSWAMDILNYLCVNKQGKTKADIQNKLAGKYEIEDDQLSFLIRNLILDGYLIKDDGLIRFLSPMLRDYWNLSFC